MTSLSLASYHELHGRRHGHFFSISHYRSFNLHIRSPWLFDVDRWFHFALPARAPREAHDDIVQGMEEARAAWLQHSPSKLLSHQSYELRDMLGRSDNRFHMYRMRDYEVAKALYNEVKDGSLIFVPERDEMRRCVQAIREQREDASRSDSERARLPNDADMLRSIAGKSPRAPRNLGNAKPFEYTKHALSDDVQKISARGVSEFHEAECFAEYERNLDECNLYKGMTNAAYTFIACKQNAFTIYNQCRGY
ncbi:hypothetical protein [Paraburkholderia atlantica]|uniref:hypothetical protein n=1 Tax=Paraburkholderia atlantica TaxID=2654982 RepID=UPI0016124679|nr:hypothetical protein [Paraburkholderia atlantica]MBB5511286.1 hypothetical protein [Paraburkholderia atlantica]